LLRGASSKSGLRLTKTALPFLCGSRQELAEPKSEFFRATWPCRIANAQKGRLLPGMDGGLLVGETWEVGGSLDWTAICFSRVAWEKPRLKVKDSSPAVPGGRMSAFNSVTGQ